MYTHHLGFWFIDFLFKLCIVLSYGKLSYGKLWLVSVKCQRVERFISLYKSINTNRHSTTAI